MNNDDNNQDKDVEKTCESPEPTNAVGFCRPPQSTRFKKGVSGNPKGVSGWTMVNNCFQSSQCDQNTSVILAASGQPTRLHFMFPAERQLLAQEQVLGDQSSPGTGGGLEESEQLGRQVQESRSESSERRGSESSHGHPD